MGRQNRTRIQENCSKIHGMSRWGKRKKKKKTNFETDKKNKGKAEGEKDCLTIQDSWWRKESEEV